MIKNRNIKETDELVGLQENVKNLFHNVINSSVKPDEIKNKIINELEDSVKELGNKIESIEENTRPIEENVDNFKTDINDIKTDILKIIKDLKETDTDISAIVSKLKSIENNLYNITSEDSVISKLGIQIGEIKDHYNSASVNIKSFRKSLDDIGNKIAKINSYVMEVELLKNELSSTITNITEALDINKEMFNIRFDNIDNKITKIIFFNSKIKTISIALGALIVIDIVLGLLF